MLGTHFFFLACRALFWTWCSPGMAIFTLPSIALIESISDMARSRSTSTGRAPCTLLKSSTACSQKCVHDMMETPCTLLL